MTIRINAKDYRTEIDLYWGGDTRQFLRDVQEVRPPRKRNQLGYGKGYANLWAQAIRNMIGQRKEAAERKKARIKSKEYQKEYEAEQKSKAQERIGASDALRQRYFDEASEGGKKARIKTKTVSLNSGMPPDLDNQYLLENVFNNDVDAFEKIIREAFQEASRGATTPDQIKENYARILRNKISQYKAVAAQQETERANRMAQREQAEAAVSAVKPPVASATLSEDLLRPILPPAWS